MFKPFLIQKSFLLIWLFVIVADPEKKTVERNNDNLPSHNACPCHCVRHQLFQGHFELCGAITNPRQTNTRHNKP